MKIVHISTSDSTGAGLAAFRTHTALVQEGIDSKMLVLSKRKNAVGVYQVQSLKSRLLHNYDRVCIRFPFLQTFKTEQIRAFNYSRQIKSFCSTPYSYVDLSRHPLVCEADIIHIHWANGFLDYSTFFNRIKKPIIITVHDENFFMGACHHSSFYDSNAPIEKDYYEVKKNALYSISNLTVIMLSYSFYQKFKSHEFLKNAKIEFVPNPVDTSVFHPYDKCKARRLFQLPQNDILFSFVGNLKDKNKGLHFLLDALALLNLNDVKVLAIGPNRDNIVHPNLISVGEIRDEHTLAKYFSASDYFVLSSVQESFSQTAIESQACGIPGIMFPVGIAPQLITVDNGILCDNFSSENLSVKIQEILKRSYNHENIRNNIIFNYSLKSVANKLMTIYKSILSC